MGNRFPELKYCDLDWKAEQIVTDNYPSWYVNRHPKDGTLQTKEEDGETATHAKCSRKASTKTANKRTKIAEFDEMPIDSGTVAPLTQVMVANVSCGLQVCFFGWYN